MSATMAGEAAARHPNQFNILRLLAALAVLASHGLFLYRLELPVPFAGHSLGAVAVYVFFFISGYLVAQSWERSRGPFDFAAKRVGRIYPGLIVSTLFSVVVIGALVTTVPLSAYWGDRGTWLNLANNMAGISTVQVLPGVFEHNPFARAVNGSLWTIRYELLMYALLGLMAWVRAQRHRWAYAVCAGALALIWWAGSTQGWPAARPGWTGWLLETWSPAQITMLGVYFFVGSAFARLRVRHHWGWGWLGVLALIGARSGTQQQWIQLALWVGIPSLTFYLAWAGRHIVSASSSVSAWLRPQADLSYGVYIYAFPIQQAVTQWSLANGWSLMACLSLSLVATVGMAAFSWFWVEKPALDWTRAALKIQALSHRE